MKRNLSARTLLLLFTTTFILYGCSGKKSGVKSPKEAADLFIECLKANDFKKFSVMVPVKSDFHPMIEQKKMTKEEREAAYERLDEAFKKRDPADEMKAAFDNVRQEYGEEFWKGVKITGYEGLETSEGPYEMEMAEVFIKLESSSKESLELKLGEIVKVKGRWILTTEPRWI